MLFLAVTLGFMVENLRERYVEHQREDEYAGLLYEDLKKDSAWLNRVIAIKEWRGKKIDSLVNLMNLPDLQKKADSIYYFSEYLFLDLSYEPNDVTIQQLRNSGSLRYFRNLQLYNSITLYYNDCAFYLDREKALKPNVPAGLRAKIFKANEFASLRNSTSDIKDVISYPKGKMELYTTDKYAINEFLHYADDEKLANGFSIMFLSKYVATELKTLLNDLKKEYHLK